jgi:Uma2 family endonuclease
MTTVKRLQILSPEEYLALEQRSDVRHELVGGQLFAMVGASNIHNLIAVGLVTAIRARTTAPCQVYVSDMKVRVRDNFYYPDIVVSCEAVTGVSYFLNEPVLIVEILSSTTEGRDRVEKSLAYRSLSTLREYLLVSQDRIQAELLKRVGTEWEVTTYNSGDELTLEAVGLTLLVDDIYRDVAQALWRQGSEP